MRISLIGQALGAMDQRYMISTTNLIDDIVLTRNEPTSFPKSKSCGVGKPKSRPSRRQRRKITRYR